MRPEQYEHHVAGILRGEGWDAEVTPYQRDFGVDIVGERRGVRLGVQAKTWGGANRWVAEPDVMQLYGAAAYAGCSKAMMVTDSQMLVPAREIANKLGMEIRLISSVESADADADTAEPGSPRSALAIDGTRLGRGSMVDAREG
jgi:HJR/Mrr/RecB family endonuclease